MKNSSAPKYLTYPLIIILTVLVLFIVLALVVAEPLISLSVLTGLGCFLWGLKIVLKKNFGIHIRSWFHFSLWLFLTILIGFLIYSLCTGDLSFKEMFSWGGRKKSPGVLILPIAWLIMLGCAFQKAPANRPAKNALQAEQHEIDDLYEKAFSKNDFDALCELVNTFYEGENQEFFQKSPVQAAKVFEGAQRLVQLVEEEQDKKPELEDYYWLGLMYEIGFACPPDLPKAQEYYTKALSTTACWDGDPENFRRLCKEVQQRLENLHKNP